jgi:hypothetical protein
MKHKNESCFLFNLVTCNRKKDSVTKYNYLFLVPYVLKYDCVLGECVTLFVAKEIEQSSETITIKGHIFWIPLTTRGQYTELSDPSAIFILTCDRH